MKDAKPVTVNLESTKMKFLDDMVSKFGLGDSGKAIRCLIDYARENEAQQATIFSEIRCQDCG